MTQNRRIGLGFTLGFDATGGSSYTNVVGVVDGFSGPNSKADMVDISILTDSIKNKAKGQIDPGELEFTVVYDPGDDVGQALSALYIQRSPLPQWILTYSDQGGGTATVTFFAHLSGLDGEAMKDKLVNRKITLTLSGSLPFPTS